MPATRIPDMPLASTKAMRQALLPYSHPNARPLPKSVLIDVKVGAEREDLSDVDAISFPVGASARESYRTPAGKKVSAFQWRLYDLVRSIELGKVTTYGILAQLTAEDGGKGSARAVGSALRNNPFAPKVPCHRIVNADLYISGFAGDYGLQASLAPADVASDGLTQRKGTKGGGEKVWKKVEMLAREGVAVDGRGYIVGGDRVVWRG